MSKSLLCITALAIVLFCACGTAAAEKKEKPKFRWWFQKETGLVNVAAPPKELMAPLSLEECMDIALKNHLPLQIAQKNIKLAEMRLFEARRNMLPTVGFRWERVEGRVNQRRYRGRKQYFEGQQSIFHGGELFFTMKQAEVNLEVVKEDCNRIKNELALQVKKAYYTLARAQENYRLQEALKGEVEKIDEMVSKALEAGAVSKLEQLNVASQASQVSFQFASASGDVDIAELILKQAMNLELKENIRIEPDLEFKKIDINFEDALHAALLNRPEMKINSLMLKYYKYEKDISKAKGWPKIDLMGSWGLGKEDFVDEDILNGAGGDQHRTKMEQQWYAGIKGSMPFWGSTGEASYTREQWYPVVNTVHGTQATTRSMKFNFLDNLKYFSDKQLSDIDLDRARQELNKITQDVTLEVKEGCFAYEKALIQLQTASNKVKYQEKDLEFTRLRRGMDELQDSNLIESMIKTAQERFGYTQAVTDCFTSVAAINKAIGLQDYFKVEPGRAGKK